MKEKDEWELKLIENFSNNLQYYYARFCFDIKKSNKCEKCEQYKNFYCKGISSSNGGKFCLSNNLIYDEDSDKLDAYQQSVRLWLGNRAKHLPSTATLYKLAKIFNCKIDDFFVDTINMVDKTYLRFLGGYFMYSRSPNLHYHVNYIYICLEGGKLVSYAKLGIDNIDSFVESIKDIDDNNFRDYFNDNDYFGEVLVLPNEAICIDCKIIRKDVEDKVSFYILDSYDIQSKIFFMEKDKIKNKPDLIQSSAGVCTTLSLLDKTVNRKIISFRFILTKKFYDTKNVKIDELFKSILSCTGNLEIDNIKDLVEFTVCDDEK